MPQHEVVVDSTVSPSRIAYSDVFNVAVPFIDRHLDEVRGGKAAIVFDDTGETVNYMPVGRAGQPLRQPAAVAGVGVRRPGADGGQGLPGVFLRVLGRRQGRA